MKIQIRNIRALERADVQVSGVVLVAGLNGKGKSTLLETTASLLTGAAMPHGLKKNQAGALVRRGAAEGGARIITDAGRVGIGYPAAELLSEGEPPRVSMVAAGLEHPADMSERDRVKLLAAYLKTTPTLADLTAAMKEVGFSEQAVEKVWKNLDKEGWDAIHKKAVEHGQTLKGQWQGTTGETYGSAKAPAWLPAGFAQDLVGASLDVLDAAVTEANQKLESAIAGAAVDQAEVTRLTEASRDLDALRAAVTETETEATAAALALTDAQSALAALPNPDGPRGLACPHCEKPIKVEPVAGGHMLVAIEAPKKPPTEAAIKKQRLALIEAEAAAKKAGAAKESADRALAAARQRVTEAEQARTKLEGMSAGGEVPGAVVDTARETLRLAQERRDSFAKKMTADRTHIGIVNNQKIIDILAPDGLRKKKTAEALASFNAILAKLSGAANWAAVSLNENLELYYGGAPARPPFVSKSEGLLRARVALQVALAHLDKSALVIIDDAEMLDAPGREGLMTMLHGAGIPALVAMTYSSAKQPPDLARAGIGRTYWIADGVATELGASQQAAA